MGCTRGFRYLAASMRDIPWIKHMSGATRALFCRLLRAFRYHGFGGFEADFGMCSIAEGFVRLGAAAAEIKGTLRNRIGGTVPIDERGIRAVDLQRSVLRYFDCRHSF